MAEDVVQDDDERFRSVIAASAVRVLAQMELCLSQEADETGVSKIADAPHHEDGAVLKRPSERLHGSFRD